MGGGTPKGEGWEEPGTPERGLGHLKWVLGHLKGGELMGSGGGWGVRPLNLGVWDP